MTKYLIAVMLTVVFTIGSAESFVDALEKMRPKLEEMGVKFCEAKSGGFDGAEIVARFIREEVYRPGEDKGASQYHLNRIMGVVWLAMAGECPQFYSNVKLHYDGLAAEEQMAKFGFGF